MFSKTDYDLIKDILKSIKGQFLKRGAHKVGRGHQFYTGTTQDASTPSLPTIWHGRDMIALVDAIRPHSLKRSEEMLAGKPTKEEDNDELNADLARLLEKPGENLR
jgi:hypothetical protein